MIHKYKFGDHVKLISSGKEMYIIRLIMPGDKHNIERTNRKLTFNEHYECAWTEGKDVHRDNFLEESLALV